MPTESDFLREIAARPDDAVLRLAYADWLDEHPNPVGGVRAELVRIEEEMWDLPVFADRYWDLKPRRNDLRRASDPEWLAALGYGTAHDPVTGYSPAYETIFAHGIPDGWKERWRLIRAFTEVWYGIPMADVGGRSAEVAEVEKRLGRTLPPAVREWVAFSRGIAFDRYLLDVSVLPGFDGYTIAHDDFGGGLHQFVWGRDASEPDPPLALISGFVVESADPPQRVYQSGLANDAGDRVTTFALGQAFASVVGTSLFSGHVPETDREPFFSRMHSEFPAHVRILDKDLFEAPELFVTLYPVPVSYPSPGLRVRAAVRSPSPEARETVPAVFWEFVTATARREGRNGTTTCPAGFCEAFDRKSPPSGRRISLIDE